MAFSETISLASGVTTTGAQAAKTPKMHTPEGVVQVDMSSTGSVTIEGRLRSDLDWQEIASFSAAGLKVIAITPEMRANIASNAGTIDIWLRTF